MPRISTDALLTALDRNGQVLPRVPDFGSPADGRPLRLVLASRATGAPTSTDSAPAYWLDHLFADADADGVPTLVEVKRATDTRIRREVVGQMLDYAANAARYWSAALLLSPWP
ncbi:hypothetical protein [Streptomyces hokutonensis]|uniref:hypothetical protein n=1 Tax=Streptomyces hokutonensis TaxID=1306990 RepID=UPI00381459B5